MTDSEHEQHVISLAHLYAWRKNDLRRISKLIHEHRRENMDMIRQAAQTKIEDYQTMIEVLRPKFNSFPEGSAEKKILQKQMDNLATAILREGQVLKNVHREGITPEKIERAKQYPIINLLPGTKMHRHCLWHDDKTPSMSITKENKVFCHACRQHGDAIDVYQILYRVSFKDAVEALQ